MYYFLLIDIPLDIILELWYALVIIKSLITVILNCTYLPKVMIYDVFI